MRVADVDADGTDDLITVSTGPDRLQVLEGGPDATFELARELALPASPWRLVVGDLDGNDHLDAVVAFSDATPIAVFLNVISRFTPVGRAYRVFAALFAMLSVVHPIADGGIAGACGALGVGLLFLTGGIFYNQVYRHWFYTLILLSLLLEATSRAHGRPARRSGSADGPGSRAPARPPPGAGAPPVPVTGRLADLAAGGARRASGPGERARHRG